MREIKFRAWDKGHKKMRKVLGFKMGLDGEIEDCEMLISEDKKGFNWTVFDDVILMQYTGLKDKNGKEIYFDDIVLDHQISPSLENKRVIRNFDDIRGQNLNVYEVIGNIWENPELCRH